MINEVEARFLCSVNGEEYEELKEKRDIVRIKAKKLQEIRMQIASLDIKSSEITDGIQISTNERILL